MNHALVCVLSLALTDLATRRDLVVEVVQKTSPAVVYIGTVQLVDGFRTRNPFQDFFYGERKPSTS